LKSANQAIKIVTDTVKLTSAVALEISRAFGAFVSLSARSTMVYLAVTADVDGQRRWFLIFVSKRGENRQIRSLHDGPLIGPFFVPRASEVPNQS
jgi:hypothetical protein